MVEVVRGVWTTEEGECGGEVRETRPQAEAEMGLISEYRFIKSMFIPTDNNCITREA